MARLSRPLVQGHRGFRAAWPENTLAGFVAALRAGAHAIELDAGLTSDGVVVVCHDPALDPDLTRGHGGLWIDPPGPVIHRSTLAELRAYDVGRARPRGPTAVAFPRQSPVDGARVPMLAEVFEATRDVPGWVDVELKTDPTVPTLTASPETLVEAVVNVAERAGGSRRLALRSFDWRALEHAERVWPALPLTWLTDAATDADPSWRGTRWGIAPDCLAGLRGATWAPDHRDVTREQIERAHALDLLVVPWTVNEPAEIARLLGWGVDGVCTDDVTMALEVISEMG